MTSKAVALVLVFSGGITPDSIAGTSPPNDDWGAATVVDALPFSDSLADISGALLQTTDPVPPCVVNGAETRGSHSVWYRYTTGDAVEYIDVSTEGSAYDTVVSVHVGEPGAFSLVPGGCNDDGVSSGQAQSRISGLQLKPNTRYSFEVISPLNLGAPASLVFTLVPSLVYQVTRFDDPQPAPGCSPTNCSLRAAITAANATGGAVQVPAGGYRLNPDSCGENQNASGDLDVRAGMGIYGEGEGATVIEAGEVERAFDIDPDILPNDPSRGNVTAHLSDLTILGTGGACSLDEAGGGGIRLRSGDANVRGNSRDFLALTRVEITDANAGSDAGGAVYTNANTHILDSRLTFNRALYGGGLFAGPGAFRTHVLIERSTLDQNHATSADCDASGYGGGAGGGAILAAPNTRLRLVNATIADNRAVCHGGAIAAAGAELVARSSTIARNIANFGANGGGRGGGLYLDNPGALLVNTVLADNVRGLAPSSRGTLEEANDCFDVTQASSTGLRLDHSLVEAAGACAFVPGTGSLIGTDPQLASLAYNGGATPTLAVSASSVAVDAGNIAGCVRNHLDQSLASDQRGGGYRRHVDGDGDAGARCDMGAYEFQGASGPEAPRLAPESDSGRSNIDGVTNADPLIFEGNCQFGERLRLYEGETFHGEAGCLDRRYQILLLGLVEGVHYFQVTSTPNGGIESAPSPATQVLIDRSVGRPVIQHPTEGAIVDGPTSVEGEHAEPGTHIVVTANGNAFCEADSFVIVPGSSFFDCSAQIDESFGETILFEAVATDIAGNTSEPSDAVTVLRGASIFADGFDKHN